VPAVETRIIDGYTYYLDEVKESERQANIMANLYRRRNGWKVRVIPDKAGYGIWINLD